MFTMMPMTVMNAITITKARRRVHFVPVGNDGRAGFNQRDRAGQSRKKHQNEEDEAQHGCHAAHVLKHLRAE